MWTKKSTFLNIYNGQGDSVTSQGLVQMYTFFSRCGFCKDHGLWSESLTEDTDLNRVRLFHPAVFFPGKEQRDDWLSLTVHFFFEKRAWQCRGWCKLRPNSRRKCATSPELHLRRNPPAADPTRLVNKNRQFFQRNFRLCVRCPWALTRERAETVRKIFRVFWVLVARNAGHLEFVFCAAWNALIFFASVVVTVFLFLTNVGGSAGSAMGTQELAAPFSRLGRFTVPVSCHDSLIKSWANDALGKQR